MSSHLRVLRHRNFRYLFLSQAASVVGDRLVVVALALFITERTRSPTDLSLVLGAATVPLVALLLFGGVWADRLPRQRIMLVTDVLRAVLHGTLAALILTGELRLWELIAIEALFGAAEAFFQPAYTGLLPQTVPVEQIQDARALTGATSNLAFLLGPAVATALVLTAGAGAAFACDAATFVISAALLLQVRVAPAAAAVTQASSSVLVELREGWREVRSRSWLWVTVAVFAGALLCVFSQWYALAPSVTRSVYGHATVFGLFEGLAGAGAVIGSIVGISWRPEHPLRVGILLVLTWPAQNALLALGAPIPAVGATALMTGFGFSLFGVWWETALARHIPAHLLSRVSAWDWMGSLALLPVGYFIAAPLAGAFGARGVLGVGGAIGVALLLVALAPRATRTLAIAPRQRRGEREMAEASA
ncbi:MAG TPA: MFS transporter [Solirubrobacteraceae bacterium]|jgi:MFS family permease|nr:MFS transporter [Solirubrobacteraceae bacterium]